MGQPYKNNEIRTAIKELCKLEQYTDKVPSEINDKIQLVIDVNPFLNRASTFSKTGLLANSAGTAIFTSDTTKDTYITGASLSVQADVLATSTQFHINYTYGGVANQQLISISRITLTPMNSSSSLSFPFPIKVDRGTGININATNNTGNFNASGTVTGFTVDPQTYDMGIGAANQ